MNKFLIAVALFAATMTNAHAWGAREQGILAGIAGTLIYQHIQQGHGHVVQHYPQQQPQVIYAPQPQPQVIYVPQQPQVIVVPQQRPYYGHGHRHGHYNGGHGYYQTPDPRVYNPQMQ